MVTRFSYCLVQASPAGSRGEYVNIGIVVLHPRSIDVRLMENPAKILALNPNFDWALLAELTETLKFWDAPELPLNQRYGQLAHHGVATLTPPGEFLLASIADYEDTVARLLKDLVIPPARERNVAANSRVSAELRHVFRALRLLGKGRDDINRHKIVEQYPINPEFNLFAEFALRNGQYHCLETVDYRTKAAGSIPKFYETGAKALVLDEARRTFGDDTGRYIVYACHADDRVKIRSELALLEAHCDRLYDLASSRDKAALGQRMKTLLGAGELIAESDAR